MNHSFPFQKKYASYGFLIKFHFQRKWFQFSTTLKCQQEFTIASFVKCELYLLIILKMRTLQSCSPYNTVSYIWQRVTSTIVTAPFNNAQTLSMYNLRSYAVAARTYLNRLTYLQWSQSILQIHIQVVIRSNKSKTIFFFDSSAQNHPQNFHMTVT